MRGTFDDDRARDVLARGLAGSDAAPNDAVLIVSRREAEIVWANPVALQVLGSLERARHVLFAATPAARAFAARLSAVATNLSPRLARLRLGSTRSSGPQLVRCTTVGIDEQEPLAILQWAEEALDGGIASMTHRDVADQPPQGSTPGPADAAEQATSQGRRPWRVLWTTDQQGIVTHVDPGFARLVGNAALAIGDRLPERLAVIDPILAADVERLLTHGGAFLTSRREWRREIGAPLPVEIGCARRRGSAGGLGGFCVFHVADDVLRAHRDTAQVQPDQGTQPDENPVRPDVVDATLSPAADAQPVADRSASGAGDSSNVVHFPGMRISSVPANFGVELRSATTVPTSTIAHAEPEPLVAPRWSEAPDPDAPIEGLSPDEQDAFAHIGQVLGTKHPTGESPAAATDPASGTATTPDITPLLEELPLPLVWQVGEFTGANTLFRHQAGYGDGPAPLELVTLDAGGTTAHLAGAGGVSLDARVITVQWLGQPARLFVVPQVTVAAADLSGVASADSGDPAPDASALDIAADGHALIADDGTILQVSAAGARLFGYAPADLAGRPVTDLAMPDSRDDWQDLLGTQSGIGTRALLGRTRTGLPLPVLARVGRIAANGLLIAWIDDGERRRIAQGLDAARREAERTSALKSEFLAKVSHEIRTPLNAILGFTEVIRDERLGPVGNDRYVDYLKDIHASGTHVLSLVNDLLDLSRIEAGRMDLRLEAVDINAIVAACVSSLQTQAHRERIIVRLSLAPGLPAALADERSLRQIVLNLLSNAIKFNEPGGQVIVSTALAEHETVAVRIRDTGIGMTESEIETAMEPFRQVSAVKRTGSGLGLSVTKALVEANCAVMTIRSTPNQGTLVEVAFPMVEHNSMSLPAE